MSLMSISTLPQRFPRPAGHLIIRPAALLLLIWLALLFIQSWQGTYPPAPVTITLRAYLPQNGGWLSAEPLHVVSGASVRLAVEAVEGAHRLHIAHTDIASAVIAPGMDEVLTFTAPAPGRYVIQCTIWCGRDHWRMRTVLEVSDPAAPQAPLQYVQDDPRYELPLDELNIDASHPARFWPRTPVSSADGEALWQVLSSGTAGSAVAAQLNWPLVSPSDLYGTLADGELVPGGDDVDDNARWALVAYLWGMKSTPDILARGESVYADSCASCHGDDGSGQGFAAVESPEVEPDLRLAPMAAGASPAQYYAKIARGGMGTGMPNWGTILSEDDLWAVTEYLYSFLFNDPVQPNDTVQAEISAAGSHH